MSAELEGVLFFGVMGGVILTVLAFSIVSFKKSKNLKRSLSYSAVLCLILFSMSVVWWFFQASDGFSQIFGALLYGTAFVLTLALVTLILFFANRRRAPQG